MIRNSYQDAVQHAAHSLSQIEAIFPNGISRGMEVSNRAYLMSKFIEECPELAVQSAQTDSETAIELTRQVAKRLKRFQPVPAVIQSWFASEILEENPKRSPRKKNAPDGLHLCIVMGVLELVHVFDIKPTRNDASPEHSACDAMAEALRISGLRPSSYAEVKRIFLRGRKSVSKVIDLKRGGFAVRSKPPMK